MKTKTVQSCSRFKSGKEHRATYITKVLLYKFVCSLVHQIVVVILQHFNAVQSSQLFNQQAKFLSFTQFPCSLKRCIFFLLINFQFRNPTF